MRMHNPAHPGKILANYIAGRSVTEVARHLESRAQRCREY
jgi:plasmid maintenance system antidote protein VapI